MSLKSNPFICRSALYMPASNTRALEKGPSLAADAIVIDLEDSVAPESKLAARENAIQSLRSSDYGHRITVLRVNDLNTEWFKADLAVLEQVQPDAILLPKVESAEAIIAAHKAIDALDSSGNVSLWAMLETPKAVVNAVSIAQSCEQHTRFKTVCVGNNDLAREAGMKVSADRSLLLPWLSSLVVAAKAYKLNILDGVYNDFNDLDGFSAECLQGAAMGMDGKTLIHPKQIDITNQAFSPSKDDVEQARNIVSEFAKPENAALGVVQIDGKMVERLHLSMAEQLLELVERIEER